jgi:hypothetical protein
MKRWHWVSLALLGGILAVTLVAVPRFSGGAPHAAAQAAPSIQIDMNPSNGSGPCNPIDPSRDTQVGDTYQVAICLENAPSAPAAFGFDLLYNDQLNTCVVTTGDGNLDSNPDANTGTTTFGGTSLGASGWDCTGVGVSPPNCDHDSATGPGHGDAFLGCFQTVGTPTLPTGQGVASPLAEVTFHAIAGGVTDTLTIVSGSAADVNTTPYLSCPELGSCGTASDVKIGDTPVAQPTATSTPTVGPSATPNCGREGLPACTPTPRAHTPTPTTTATATAAAGEVVPPTSPPPPPPPSSGAGGNVRPPNTGEGSDGTPWGASFEWIAAAAAGISLAGGAFYLRRVRMRR